MQQSSRLVGAVRHIAGAIALIACTAMTTVVVAQEELLDAFFADLPTDPRELADKIVQDVAEIRGLPFTGEIAVTNQTQAEFEEYLASEMDRSLPEERASVYGRVIQKLGLYKGPMIEDSVELFTLLATSQAAAYYDPNASAFHVLIGEASMALLAPIYAHELYHGLQDQHWDLNEYLLDGIIDGLNDDEMLARQSVVEGEATYIMTLWMLREVTGVVPSGLILDLAIQVQTEMDSAAMRDMVNSGIIPGSLSEDLQASIEAMDQIPQFMMETMIGVYIKGMGFVHQIVKGGWDEAARLYTDPPQSTEQVLHPEKWLVRDEPVRIELPDLETASLTGAWDLLDSNVIGEFQLRIIFNEFDMRDVADVAAAGWDGDRFAVLERDGELLLLLFTTWDSVREAEEFASAYRQLLNRKYTGEDHATAVELRGADVLIVEGGDPENTADFIDLLATATKS